MPEVQRLYCSCGATASFAVSPANLLNGLLEMWGRYHSGPGHEPTDRQTCGRIRARRDREVLDADLS